MRTTVEMAPGARLLRLESAIASFTDILRVGALDARIPACPDWDLRYLAWHLGHAHRWAGRCLIDGPAPFPTEPGPDTRTELVTWYRESAAQLLTTLRRSGPTAECWTFDPENLTAGFWVRRQMHETVMHLWDAQRSQGDPEPMGPLVAADGVAEALGFFLPRQIRLERLEEVPGRLLIELTDVCSARWLLRPDGAERLAPDRAVRIAAGENQRARIGTAWAPALVRGPAQAVLLLLWHRLSLHDPRLEYAGDRPSAQEILASALTP
ncbi:MAG: hypothetical protein QG608_8 [Actinomycetota bacterium]|nr:hypothetical protein [Actinomycetota bacterium]